MALRVAFSASISGQPGVDTGQIGALYGFYLFDTKRDLESAFQLFYKLKIDPILILGLCPDMLSGEEPSKSLYPTTPTVCYLLIYLLIQTPTHILISRVHVYINLAFYGFG